jgi:hypothetical protein
LRSRLPNKEESWVLLLLLLGADDVLGVLLLLLLVLLLLLPLEGGRAVTNTLLTPVVGEGCKKARNLPSGLSCGHTGGQAGKYKQQSMQDSEYHNQDSPKRMCACWIQVC